MRLTVPAANFHPVGVTARRRRCAPRSLGASRATRSSVTAPPPHPPVGPSPDREVPVGVRIVPLGAALAHRPRQRERPKPARRNAGEVPRRVRIGRRSVATAARSPPPRSARPSSPPAPRRRPPPRHPRTPRFHSPCSPSPTTPSPSPCSRPPFVAQRRAGLRGERHRCGASKPPRSRDRHRAASVAPVRDSVNAAAVPSVTGVRWTPRHRQAQVA